MKDTTPTTNDRLKKLRSFGSSTVKKAKAEEPLSLQANTSITRIHIRYMEGGEGDSLRTKRQSSLILHSVFRLSEKHDSVFILHILLSITPPFSFPLPHSCWSSKSPTFSNNKNKEKDTNRKESKRTTRNTLPQ